MVSPNTIHFPVVRRSSEPNQIAVLASSTSQPDFSDTETQRSTEESAATDDSVSPIQAVFDINIDTS
jgi:hypothetical protein